MSEVDKDFGSEAGKEAVRDVEAILGESRQKSRAIKRHYRVVTDLNSPSEQHLASLRALGILSRDTGKKFIVNSLNHMVNTKHKNPIAPKIIKQHK